MNNEYNKAILLDEKIRQIRMKLISDWLDEQIRLKGACIVSDYLVRDYIESILDMFFEEWREEIIKEN